MRGQPVFLLFAMLFVAMPIATQAAMPAVKIEADKFSKLATFTGPPFGKSSFFGTDRVYRLRSWVNRNTSLAVHQLYIDVAYVDVRREYYRAANDDAQDLELKTIDIEKTTRGCRGLCGYTETIGLDVSESFLMEKQATGFQVKLYARTGDTLILDIPADQIALQLRALADYRNGPSNGPAAAAPLPAVAPPFGVDFGTAPPMWGLPGGALVAMIKGNSVAGRSGLHWADAITEWDGQAVTSAAQIQALLAKVKAGSQISFKALRGRRIHDLVAQF